MKECHKCNNYEFWKVEDPCHNISGEICHAPGMKKISPRIYNKNKKCKKFVLKKVYCKDCDHFKWWFHEEISGVFAESQGRLVITKACNVSYKKTYTRTETAAEPPRDEIYYYKIDIDYEKHNKNHDCKFFEKQKPKQKKNIFKKWWKLLFGSFYVRID